MPAIPPSLSSEQYFALAMKRLTAMAGIPMSYLDTDVTLASDSNVKVPTVAALRAYVASIGGFDGAWASLTGVPTTIGGFGITDFNSLGDARWQAVDADLTALAALTTTAFGRDFNTVVDAAAARTKIGAGVSSFDGVFASLTSKPTTIAGYGIADAFTQAAADALYSVLAHVHTFVSLTSKPTTIAGYGITDLNSLGDARWTLQTITVNGHALSANVTVTAGDLSLGNVTNTTDAGKPVSTAQQTALDLKANLASPTLTGTPVLGAATFTSLSAGADPADAGQIRLSNAGIIAWEASPASTDVTLTVNTSEQFVFSNTIQGPTFASTSGSYNQPQFFQFVSGDTNWGFGVFNSSSEYWVQSNYGDNARDGLRGFRVQAANSVLTAWDATLGRTRTYYDASNYFSSAVSSTGGVTFDAVGSGAGFTFNDRIINTVPHRLKGYTVAGLPAGTQGDTAFATDLLTPTFLVAAVGGGAVVGPVFYNGASWVTY